MIIRVSHNVKVLVMQAAKAEGITVSEWVRRAVAESQAS